MKVMDEDTIQETLQMVGKMNGLVKELLLATSRLHAALSGRDVNASARAMDLRQGILENATRLREQLSENLDSFWRGVSLPEKIAAVLEENRKTLVLVHEMEKECMTVASGYRDEIKDQLGQVRAVKKMKVYHEGGGNRQTGPPRLIRKKV